MRKACDGLILRVTDVGTHDRSLVLLTADEGKLHIIAKGARSVKSKYASLCRICAHVNVELYEKQQLHWLSGGSLNNAFFDLCEDLCTFSLATYIMQLAEEITGEDMPAEDVLRMSLNTLYALEKKLYPIEHIKATYELFAAGVSGFVPDLSSCADCSCSDFKGDLWLDVMNGALLCDECKAKRNIASSPVDTDKFETRRILLPINTSVLEAMRYVLSAPLQRIFSYGINDQKSFDMFCRTAELYLLNHLERDFSTLHFYRSISKEQ